jgi:hypothetical protein
MDNPLKPQPLMAEVLPGFTVLLILGSCYVIGHPTRIPQLEQSILPKFLNGAAVIAGGFGFLLTCWIVGTFLDTIRDLIESAIDVKFPVNWSFLLQGPADTIQKLNDSWLAYYFLNGNMAIGLLLVAICGLFDAFHISGWYWGLVLVPLSLYGYNTWTLRQELRRLIGWELGMPHAATYARVSVSNAPPSKEFPARNPGVGVFAVKDIPKGTLIFAPDDDSTITISSAQVATLPSELRSLYEDFCPQSAAGDYTCPLNFNKLTVAWYLNDSDVPNVNADDQFRFLANRDIKKGEELFCSYKDLVR